MPRLMRTSGIATATWRKRLASRTYRVGRGDAMTAAFCTPRYWSILASAHHGAARLELEAVARGPSYARACFALLLGFFICGRLHCRRATYMHGFRATTCTLAVQQRTTQIGQPRQGNPDRATQLVMHMRARRTGPL